MKKRKVIASLAAVSMVSTLLGTTQPAITQAATKLQVSVSKCTLQVGKTKTVSANKKVTWKSSNKKVATVKKITGKKAKITAKKKGTCKITAIAGKKKSVIKVTVRKATVKPTVTPTVTTEPVTNGAITTNSSITPQTTPTTDTQVYMNETCGVSVSLSDIKTTGGTLTIKNNSGTDIAFGLDYAIEKYENGQWTALTSNPVAIPAVAIALLNGKDYTSSLNWEKAYGSLEQGTYRVVKSISVHEQGSKKIAYQFVIDGTTQVGATSTPVTEEQKNGATATPIVATPTVTTSVDITAPQTANPDYSPLHTLTPEEQEQLGQAIPEKMPTVTMAPIDPEEIPAVTTVPTDPQGTPMVDAQVYMNETCGVSISLADVKTTDGSVTIKNDSGADIYFGLDFSIEKYENGQWTKLPSNPVIIPSIAIGVQNGDTYTTNYNWVYEYGSLEQGTYRVIKTIFTHDQGTKYIASQLVIDENTEIGATPTPTAPAPAVTEAPVVATAAPAVTPAVPQN